MTTIAPAPRVLRDAPPGLHPEGAPQDDEHFLVAPKSYVILGSRPEDILRRRLEGRTGHSARSLLGGLAILLVIALALAGCGKKGAPQPPPDEPNTYPRTYPNA